MARIVDICDRAVAQARGAGVLLVRRVVVHAVRHRLHPMQLNDAVVSAAARGRLVGDALAVAARRLFQGALRGGDRTSGAPFRIALRQFELRLVRDHRIGGAQVEAESDPRIRIELNLFKEHPPYAVLDVLTAALSAYDAGQATGKGRLHCGICLTTRWSEWLHDVNGETARLGRRDEAASRPDARLCAAAIGCSAAVSHGSRFQPAR